MTGMDAPVRVVIVSRAPHGGHPRYCAELARALHDEGAAVAIAQPASAFADSADLFEGVPIERVRIPDVSAGWHRQEAAIVSFLHRRGGPGIVVFEESSPLRAASLLLLNARTSWRLATMVHNTRPHGAGRVDRLRHVLGLAALSVPHRVLVHNELQRDELMAFPMVRASSIDVVPHGVWTEWRATASPERSFDAPVTKLLMFGVMRANSGLRNLEELARRLSFERPEVSISVIGRPSSSDVSAQLDRLAAIPTVEVQQRFVANSEVRNVFDSHDALVLPYTNYTSESGVLIEAVGAKMPVVTAGAGSVVGRVRELGIGPAPEGSLYDQTIAMLDASPQQRQHWDDLLVAARSTLSWNAHARILLAS